VLRWKLPAHVERVSDMLICGGWSAIVWVGTPRRWCRRKEPGFAQSILVELECSAFLSVERVRGNATAGTVDGFIAGEALKLR
jgi:hypothetical protein